MVYFDEKFWKIARVVTGSIRRVIQSFSQKDIERVFVSFEL